MADQRARLFAWILAATTFALVCGAMVATVVSGSSWADAVNGFMVTNTAMAVSFSVCGLIISVRRSANPIGWLFLADGLGHAITAAAIPLIRLGLEHGWPSWTVRLVTTCGAYSWPWSISLFLPLALLLFPDGRPPNQRWRWPVWSTAITAPLFVAAMGTDPGSPVPGGPAGYLVVRGHEQLSVLWQFSELCVVLLYGADLVALTVRYRRGDDRERRQLLWLILATTLTVGVLIPWGLFLAGPVLLLLAVPLIGAAVTVAILRHQLLDIRQVLSRTVLYLLLIGGVVLTFEILVALLDVALRRQSGLGPSVLASVLVAVGFNPARERLQQLMERANNATEARQPTGGSRAGDAARGLSGMAETVRTTLDLPFVALRTNHGEICSSGTVPETLQAIPLTNGPERIGELLVGVPPRTGKPSRSDRAILELLATPLSVALLAARPQPELHGRSAGNPEL